MMNIAIIGVGGIGGYFGGKLANAGHDVTFVARGKHLEALQNNGLIVKSINGDFTVTPVKTASTIQQLENPDLVVMGVKAWQIKDAAAELKRVIKDHTMVLPLQNGITASDELMEHLPAENVLGGTCRIISQIEAPGVIRHSAVDPVVVIGELNGENTPRIQTLSETFQQAGINTMISRHIDAALWKKLIGICSSALLAVTRTTYGEARECPETWEMMRQLIYEIHEVAKKVGIPLDESVPQKNLEALAQLPYDSTSSLTRDVMEGRPSEIEHQNGIVVKLGEKYGVPTPVNRFIYHCILPMERKARQTIK